MTKVRDRVSQDEENRNVGVENEMNLMKDKDFGVLVVDDLKLIDQRVGKHIAVENVGILIRIRLFPQTNLLVVQDIYDDTTSIYVYVTKDSVT